MGSRLLLFLFIVLPLPQGAMAQTAPGYVVAYALRGDGNVKPLPNNGRLIFAPTPATVTAIADVVVANQGSIAGTARSIFLSGSAFQFSNLPLLPATIEPGQALRFSVLFTPRQLGSFTGALRIELDGQTISTTVEGSTSAPEFSVAYIDPASGNTLVIADGGTLTFPPTITASNTTFAVLLRNLGQGTGFINAINATGDAFRLLELPPFPVTLSPLREFRFSLRFAPQQRDVQSGSLHFEFSQGTFTIALSGSGIGPHLTYDVTGANGETSALLPNAELALSSPVGQTASKVVRIANTGNSEARIAAISTTGASFQLSNVPFLPIIIPANGSQTFTVNFTPAQPDTVRGRLRVGDHTFDLVGTGVGGRLELTYTNDAGTTSLAEGGSILLTPVRVGEFSQVEIAIQNTGTTAIAVSTINVTPANSVFTIEGAPSLPLSLNPGNSERFRLWFAPNNTGNTTALFRVNNSTFNVSGSGLQPVALPAHQIIGTSGTEGPLQQPSVGVTLASPYALPLRGTLTMSFLSDVFTENPAVQFASGGRSANFTIPADSTQAVFENGSTGIKLQTGTVAGTIQMKPTFSTQAGLDLTPESPASLSITIQRSAPQLLSAEISNRTANSVLLVAAGYSTTRTLRQLTVQITPRGDGRFTATTLAINIEAASLVWFQNAQSQGFGGLFSLSIPIAFQRGKNDEDLIRHVQSFGVTVSNEIGNSDTVSIGP